MSDFFAPADPEPDELGANYEIDEQGWSRDRPSFAGLCEFEACASGWEWARPLYPAGFRVWGRCRQCGCTERRACRDGGHGCFWVEDGRLCSRCARFPGRRRWRRRRAGDWTVQPLFSWWYQRRHRERAVLLRRSLRSSHVYP